MLGNFTSKQNRLMECSMEKLVIFCGLDDTKKSCYTLGALSNIQSLEFQLIALLLLVFIN